MNQLELQEDGTYREHDASKKRSNFYQVNDQRVLDWISAGNTPTPYSAPVKTWEENRQAEYPTIEELVVALYDTDDKAAIEKRRADVKAKYPKTS